MVAHCAEVNNQGTVLRVIVVDETYNVFDDKGKPIILDCEAWCNRTFGGTWKKTDYNTVGGVHALGGVPFRKNYAGIGFTYDNIRDAFIPPKLGNNFKLDEQTCQWVKK